MTSPDNKRIIGKILYVRYIFIIQNLRKITLRIVTADSPLPAAVWRWMLLNYWLKKPLLEGYQSVENGRN